MIMTNHELETTILDLGAIPKPQHRRVAIQKLFGNRPVCEPGSVNAVNLVLPARDPNVAKTVLTAHYDVVPGSRGYNDNLSGIMTLLLIHDTLPDNVEIVLTDKEERGFIGASDYVARHRARIRCNINIDIVGVPDTLYYHDYSHGAFRLPPTCAAVPLDAIPFNDSWAFDDAEIPSLILMSGPAIHETDRQTRTRKFITAIFRYQHGGCFDNDIQHLDMNSIRRVAALVLDLCGACSPAIAAICDPHNSPTEGYLP